jgi:hypothetical protein
MNKDISQPSNLQAVVSARLFLFGVFPLVSKTTFRKQCLRLTSLPEWVIDIPFSFCFNGYPLRAVDTHSATTLKVRCRNLVIGLRARERIIVADPLIAIVGSADPARKDYDPPIRYVEHVAEAAQQLGSELAKAGYRILVYSSADKYIEKDVVAGYVASGKAKPESIQIRYPQVVDPKGPTPFPEQSTHDSLFERHQDTHPNWVVSFYSSLREVDGILLLGGANSALITGLVAHLYRIPLVSISTFGGSAQTVWALSIRKLATDGERNLMGLPDWNQNLAPKLITILAAQRERLVSEQAQRL